MGNFALDAQGSPVIAMDVPASVWESWKGNSMSLGFTMACCGSAAVPKTSLTGLQFYAHHSDECATAPETIWHREAKAVIVDAMRQLGVECAEEVIEKGARPWKADILVRYGTRRVALEIQHSYQHLRDYLRRQERYAAAGVDCVWLLPAKRYLALAKLTGRKRIKDEFGGKFPPCGYIGPCLAGLPVVMLREPATREIGGASLRATLDIWCRALVEGRFVWSDGTWVISKTD